MAPEGFALQQLWDYAQQVFAQGGVPTPQQLQTLRAAMSAVPLEEVGMLPGFGSTVSLSSPSSSSATSRPPITYLHIQEDSRVSLGIFCIPARAQIPLHNHPDMTVLSKVIYGRMHATSYDWADGATSPEAGDGREAVLAYDATMGPDDEATMLFPTTGGNMHRFTAVTDCAVLDLLSPPYSSDDGRDCSYYTEVTSLAPGSRVMLADYEPPVDFVIHSGDYQGVCIMAAQSTSTAAYDSSTSGSGSSSPVSVGHQDEALDVTMGRMRTAVMRRTHGDPMNT